MTIEGIIRMAKQAGFADEEIDYCQQIFIHFAMLIAEHEREACAKTCEQITSDMSKWHSAYLGVTSETKFIRKTGEIIGQPFIEAIRARGSND